MNKHLRLETNCLFHYRKATSGLTTLATPSPRGQIYPHYIYPKRDAENLKNPKEALGELAAEYDSLNLPIP